MKTTFVCEIPETTGAVFGGKTYSFGKTLSHTIVMAGPTAADGGDGGWGA